MSQLNLFIELTRLKKPIGFMLLFWPCVWGLTIVNDFNSDLGNYFFFVFLFLAGSILMRSAGCIVNDIVDKKFDKQVERTKNRPIASGKITIKLATTYAITLCGIALLVLINFNKFTIIMALLSMPLAFTYPLMKRITYWPQLFLGITFNYGLILAWISISNEVTIIPIIFYLGAIFWTLGYDTIYGFQDIKDDEIIGIKSTSIKFKSNAKLFLFSIYFIAFSFWTSSLILLHNSIFIITIFIFLCLLILIKVLKTNTKEPNECKKTFIYNSYFSLGVIFVLLGA